MVNIQEAKNTIEFIADHADCFDWKTFGDCGNA